MTHPCSSSKPPSWCNKKRSKKRKRSSCSCPSGWTQKGIMCQKGRTMKRSSCAASPKRRRAKKRRSRR